MASLRRKTNSKFWFACFYLPNGSRTQRSTKTTDRRVAQKLAEQFEEASRARITEHQAIKVISDIHRALTGRAIASQTIRVYLTRWIDARVGTTAATTQSAYKGTVEEFIGHLGAKADSGLGHLSTGDIAAFRDAQVARLSPSSANNKLKILRVAFQQAWRDGLIEHNPAAKVQLLKKAHKAVERRAFKVEELRQLVSAAAGEWRGLILFGLYTGQRLGDLVRLRTDNLDPDAQTLVLTTRKTGRRQIIPIAAALAGWLEQWKVEGPYLFPASRAVADRSGTVGGLSNQFQALMARAGLAVRRPHRAREDGGGRKGKRELSELSFHSLRHTATSLMKNAGVSPAIVQEFVGHDSKAVSQNYTHMETETLRKAAESLPNIWA